MALADGGDPCVLELHQQTNIIHRRGGAIMGSKKKITSILLMLTLLIIMIPSFAFADDLPFKDVPSSEWYYNDVKEAYDTGLINGMTDTTFEPASNMTYAQAVKLAACMNQKYTTGSVTLANGSPNWWDSYVAYAKEKNIISKDYDWNSDATRAGYVEIFAKALPEEALKEKNSIADGYIPDVTMVHPQAAAIYKLYRAGILTGMDEKGTFDPDRTIKRSEVSAILTRMMNESARKELTLGPVGELKEYSVFFCKWNGSALAEQKVKENGKVVKPEDPVREGYTFSGWYQDVELTSVYDFTSAVTRNLTLYAKWTEVAVKEYTVTFDTNGGSAIVEQKVKENERAAKPVDPAKDGYRFVGWYQDSGLTTVYDFTSAVTRNLTLYAKWKELRAPVQIADSWDEIIQSVNDGTYRSKYQIGDTRTLDLGSEGVVEMQIVAFDADELADESGNKAAITWISKQLLKSDHRMNPEEDKINGTMWKPGTGATGGWKESEMRRWLQSDIKSLIPENVRSSVKRVKKYSNSCDTYLNEVVDECTNDDLWIPSLKEIGVDEKDYTFDVESMGPVYTDNIDIFGSRGARMKRKEDSSYVSWWLRSATGTGKLFWLINAEGKLTHTLPNYTRGVLLGFCL